MSREEQKPDKMERIVLVSKQFYADLLSVMEPQERILSDYPRGYPGSMAIVLVSPTPEGPRYLYFLREE